MALGTAIERFSRVDLEAFMQQVSPSRPGVSKPDSTDHREASSSTHDKSQEHLLAAALLGTGSGSIVYGVGRYFSNMRMLEKGLFKPSYFGAGALGLTIASVTGAVYWTGFKSHKHAE